MTSTASAPAGPSSHSGARPVAELQDVSRIYKMGETEVRALDGINHTFREGDYWSIMGSSGSGKSTLLNILGCIDRPSKGDYVVRGRGVLLLVAALLRSHRAVRHCHLPLPPSLGGRSGGLALPFPTLSPRPLSAPLIGSHVCTSTTSPRCVASAPITLTVARRWLPRWPLRRYRTRR